MTRLTLTALLLLVPFAVASSCLPSCRFHLCTPSRVSLLTPSDRPLYPICLNSNPIGVANTGEALVQSFSSPFKPVSQLRLHGLSQPYSPHFFKSYSFQPIPEAHLSFAAVGHEVPQGNQASFLEGKCVVLPLSYYQKLENGIVVDNVIGDDPLVDCVSFVVGSPAPTVTPEMKPMYTPEEQAPVGPQLSTEPEIMPEITFEPEPEPSPAVSESPEKIIDPSYPEDPVMIETPGETYEAIYSPEYDEMASPEPSVEYETSLEDPVQDELSQ